MKDTGIYYTAGLKKKQKKKKKKKKKKKLKKTQKTTLFTLSSHFLLYPIYHSLKCKKRMSKT